MIDSIFSPYPQVDPPYPQSQFFSDWDGENAGFPGVENVENPAMTALDIYVYSSAETTVIVAIGASYSYQGGSFTTYHGYAYDHYPGGTLLPQVTKHTVDLTAHMVSELKVYAAKWSDNSPTDNESAVMGLGLMIDGGPEWSNYGSTSGDRYTKTFSYTGQILVAINGFLAPLSPPAGGFIGALGCIFGPGS